MSRNRYAAKVDNNQQEIVKKLREIPGVSVETEKDDFLIGYKKKTFWIEWKSEEAISKKTGKPYPSSIKKSQRDLQRDWTGHYKICWTFEMVLKEIGINQ